MSTRSKSKAAAKQRRGKAKKSEHIEEKENEPKPEQVFCSCRKGDDGSPMVLCTQCDEWYHFTCVNLAEPEADEIYMYVCPTCTEKTGLRSVMTWEGGPEAVEPIAPKKPAKKTERVLDELPPSESDNEPSSQDEYVAETEKARVKGTKRRTRRLAYSESDSDSSSASERPATRRRAKATSPGLKRKTTANPSQPASKRKKTVASDATDDPTRKYCLGKLEEVFRDIFLRYPHVKEADEWVEKKPEGLLEEDKSRLLDEAKQFAADLEHCMYETYSEPDKQGKACAGAKYKDRFRTLQFNLSKVDRVVLHKRIASRRISAEEISVMSSTDLANEETKQSIKIAEQEALEHSILQKSIAPRAKITHKGLQDIEIEDIDGTETAFRERERQRELEQEERMERERLARVKAAQSTRQRTASLSVPPESPITPQSATWGGPPALPVHALPDTFIPQAPDITMAAPEMDLGDLINIDDEPPSPTQDIVPASPIEPSPTEPSPKASPPPSTVGISPFASNVVRPEAPRSTFDLNSLWSAPTEKVESPPPREEGPKESIPEPSAAAGDQDFDMFLQENDQSSPEALQAAFDAKETVWTGKINMPLDSTIPQETPVIARQMAGRPLAADSPLWKSLFPSDLLRIDGRVPVDKSAQFLLQIRMNPSKELMAVAFSPASPNNDSPFRILMDFLIAKGRHGLVFPWGTRPKDTHPGRELYIIPLLSSDPVPDYMQLLDNMQLPKARQVNYLIGIWILGKGKLKAPSPPPSVPVPAAAPPPSISPAVPDLSQLLPQLSSTIAKLPATVDQKALAAEVAQLTPVQVQEMLRTLGAVTNPAPVPAASAPLQPQGPPSNMVPPGPGWPPNPGYPGFYQPPPTFPPQGPPIPGQVPPPPAGHMPQYGRPPYDRPPGGYRGDRQDRGGRRGGRGRNNNRSPPRQPDSGWPRRGGTASFGQGSPPTKVDRRW